MPDARHPGNRPTRVTIREVGARDGIQSVGAFIETRYELTGVALSRLIGVARRAQESIGHKLSGQVMKAGPRWQRHAA